MTWNAEGILSNGRELALLGLLNDNDFDVGIITETEIPTISHGDFNVEGYHTFLPVTHSDLLKTAKYRVMIVVKSTMAELMKIRHDLMHPAEQSIWVQVDLGNRFLVGGLYREWSDLPREYAALTRIKDQVQAAAAEVDSVVFAGNVHLDTARRGDKKYGRRCLLLAHDNNEVLGDGGHVPLTRPPQEGGWRGKGPRVGPRPHLHDEGPRETSRPR
jgi:hypothetical protein